MAHEHVHEAHRHGGHHDSAAPGDVAPTACGHAADINGLDAEQVAECPVMPGSSVIKADAEAAGLFRDHDGTRYWFCCDSCGPTFDADPQRFATAA